jgi:NAD-dependent deacetylase
MDALIDRAVELLKLSRNAVALTGAGISTPSGIPDYRSPRSGLWETVDMLEVATIAAFRKRPQAFYEWLRPLAGLIMEAKPNPAHIALARLENHGPLRAIVTQNIDLLHSKAGSRNIFEIHGHLREAVCLACHAVADAAPLLESFLKEGVLPRCQRCHHIMKPNVVLFGELLPYRTIGEAKSHARTSDLMIVAGSSLEVSPASELPLLAKQAGARLIIINYSETHLDHLADLVIRADVAEVLPCLAAAFDKELGYEQSENEQSTVGQSISRK